MLTEETLRIYAGLVTEPDEGGWECAEVNGAIVRAKPMPLREAGDVEVVLASRGSWRYKLTGWQLFRLIRAFSRSGAWGTTIAEALDEIDATEETIEGRLSRLERLPD